MSETRNLTDHERSVLEFLLQGDWDGASVLREQLSTAMYSGKHNGENLGPAAFDITIDDEAPRAPIETPVAKVGDVFLRVEDGVLVGLGCTAKVKELPPLEKLFAA